MFSANACVGGTATQGPFRDPKRPAYLAIDGNTEQSSNYAAVQDRSETAGTAWWTVDLQFRRTIVNLTILFADQGITSTICTN